MSNRFEFDAIRDSMVNGQHKQAAEKMSKVDMAELVDYIYHDLNDAELLANTMKQYFINNSRKVTSAAPAPYYLLIIKEEGYWVVEFSDFEESVVKYEREANELNHKRKHMRIVKVANALQATIDAYVGKLNENR